MKNSKLLSSTDGIITDIFIPEVYDDDTKEYLEDNEVRYIGLKININNNILTIIKPDTDKYINLFVNDKVKVNKLGYLYDYVDYREQLFEKIDIYNLQLTFKEKEQIFNEMVLSEEVYQQQPYYIIDYELEKVN